MLQVSPETLAKFDRPVPRYTSYPTAPQFYLVEETLLDDDGAMSLARDLARKIEKDMAFPGQIKINVIREKRAIEYAR